MSEIIKTEAIVLSKMNYGDSSSIASLFTEDLESEAQPQRHCLHPLRYDSVEFVNCIGHAGPAHRSRGASLHLLLGSIFYYDDTETSSTTYIAAPTFSPVAGIYLSEQTVTISSATTGVRIHYTLDGEDPTEGSPVYSTPILVPGKSWLKAFAIDPNGRIADSAITTGYYGLWAQDAIITETDGDTLITETDSNTLTTEGP